EMFDAGESQTANTGYQRRSQNRLRASTEFFVHVSSSWNLVGPTRRNLRVAALTRWTDAPDPGFSLEVGIERPGDWGGLRHDTFAHRVEDQLGNVVQVQFLHDLRAMRLDCVDTQVQEVCNLFAGLALRDQLQHLAFAGGEQLQ